MACLPLEIIENILLRLPVKSLLYCKWVCQSLVRDDFHPQFARAHLQLPQTQAKTRLCIINFEEEKDDASLVLRVSTKDGNQLEMVTAMVVDGLGKIVLWNPSTRQYNPLPPNADGPKCSWYGLGMTPLPMTTR
ncbi:hypothetical protein CK203_062810 [Vitis vinifera]|uniref:F-box domain-containing protein n=1 Tax=Vitis vinifera TaxID=29760 RepID=A0A438GBG6_VITVI|nr:hypothetical protein CK203_062810 [Vitis vinifera]